MKRLMNRIWNAMFKESSKKIKVTSKYPPMGQIIQFPRVARK